MWLNTPKEPREKCPKEIIMFNELWFCITPKDFQKLTNAEELDDYCDTCEDVRSCKSKDLFTAIFQIHNSKI